MHQHLLIQILHLHSHKQIMLSHSRISQGYFVHIYAVKVYSYNQTVATLETFCDFNNTGHTCLYTAVCPSALPFELFHFLPHIRSQPLLKKMNCNIQSHLATAIMRNGMCRWNFIYLVALMQCQIFICYQSTSWDHKALTVLLGGTVARR